MIKTEGIHTAEFLLSEGAGQISRENIEVKAGDALPAGQLLAKGEDGVYVPYDPTAEDDDLAKLGVLYAQLDGSTTVRRAVGIVRLAEVIGSLLTGLDDGAHEALVAQHIVVR
ncbi:head decoration protein [Caballeronia sp. LjRoot31]|uniref:head decoration protein n=1 Tax=Caballeronia sp. LjRoot31 TaxID=3342324 RepID=UPI003ECF994E